MKTSKNSIWLLLLIATISLLSYSATMPTRERSKISKAVNLSTTTSAILDYTADHDWTLPSSLLDKELVDLLPAALQDLEKSFIFNTKFYGKKVEAPVSGKAEPPLVIENRLLQVDGTIYIRYSTCWEPEILVEANHFPLGALDLDAQRRVTTLISQGFQKPSNPRFWHRLQF